MNENVMPDFSDALEQRLRAAATAGADPQRSPRVPRRRAPRLALCAMACLALAGVILVIGAANDDRTPRAYGRPLVLQTPPVEASEVVRALNRGVAARLAFGDDARLTEARPLRGLNRGSAFVVTGPDGWCLRVPDPAEDPDVDPLRSGAVTCARTDDVYRYGIAVGTGGNVVAALPGFARPPTLSLPDGTTRDLEPSDQGVVAVSGVEPGSVLTLYAADGTARPIRFG